MRRMKTILVFITVALYALACSEHGEHDHIDSGNTDVGHAGNIHDDDAPAAGRMSAHDHEDSEQAHRDDDDHVHESGEEHLHAVEQEHDHDGDHGHDEAGTYAAVDESWEELVGLQTAETVYRPMDLVISVPGRIVPNRNKMAEVSPFIESSVNCVFANIGDRVSEGDVLVCLTSPEVGMLRAEYGRAKAEFDIAGRTFERQKKLFEEEIIPRKTLQEAELSYRVAEVNYEYSLKKLLALGITRDEIDNPPTGHTDAVGSTIHVTAPISGVITVKNSLIGRKVGPGDRLFEIIDLTTVWLEADIFERDLTNISTGKTVRVKVAAWPDETFSGTIYYVGDVLNEDTKTIKILVEIDNRAGLLKPGMFAVTDIVVGEKSRALVVPKEAVLEDENLRIVFVRESAGYHRHIVTTGIEGDGYTEIVDGLSPGDIVVTTGAYQLKSRTRMSGIDPHAGHNH